MHHGSVHAVEHFLKNCLAGQTRRPAHGRRKATWQARRYRLDAPMFDARKRPVRPSGWISSATNKVPCLRHKAGAAKIEVVGRLTPLPWIGSTMKARHRADKLFQSARSLNGIAEKPGTSGPKLPKNPVAIRRQSTIGQAMEGVIAIDNAGRASRVARI